jgi:DNA mismatch endonuclease, patch repair protein
MVKGRLQPRQDSRTSGWDPAWSRSIAQVTRGRMAAIRSTDTKPEIQVRRICHRLGYRFRLHRGDLPGRPDLVFPKLRKVIDVRGCFWHAHTCLRGRRPTVRGRYWTPKLARTVARDRRNARKLLSMGWQVLVVWECQTRDVTRLVQRLMKFLSAPS